MLHDVAFVALFVLAYMLLLHGIHTVLAVYRKRQEFRQLARSLNHEG